MHATSLRDIVARFDHASTLDDVRAELARRAQDFGCRNYTYVYVDIGLKQDRELDAIESDAEFLTNLDPAWARRYLERGYFVVDPVVKACYRSRIPVVWSPHSIVPPVDADVVNMLMDAARVGLSRGISVPIHGFAGSFGIFSLYSTDEEHRFKSWADAVCFDVQRFAFWFHDFFAARFSHQAQPDPGEIRINIRPPARPTLH